ncbi:low molecular weight phosphatase family protein [Geodermatophilus normandii]|uniref:Low molecular weight phosphatase family protein n=1 Tax=Geodermatophilus normandii TaxID=1137989 RepID=A0A6P0GFC0_9ACTN|nr:low molecular weight phosphatase family protein [Geodermatophilus normandii]NEM05946.1 low molecular weight phosphatase family protein [Geodermatophilus normandii]
MHILFVCTGNLCRSPVAERLAAVWARESLADHPGLADLEIGSAGVRARAGQELDPASARALEQLGGDPQGFRSRPLTVDLMNGAGLVLTMTREHRREALRLDPRGLRRTFTLPEAADLLLRADLQELPTLPLQARALELGRRLDAARAHRTGSSTDDVRDPIGQHRAVHEEVASRIATALRPLVDVLLMGVRTHRSRRSSPLGGPSELRHATRQARWPSCHGYRQPQVGQIS